jgi:hypothetical protein
MLEILQHHSSTISGSANPRAFKKIAFMYALLFSILRFRSFVSPLGFTERLILDEIDLRNVLVRTKELVDALGFEEIPIRNLRDALLDVEFGASVVNSFDARKFRTHVHMLTSPDILEDGFNFIEQQSSDAGSYIIPVDSVKIPDWVHLVEKMPSFPFGDILSMNGIVSLALRNWNLSRWAMRPFVALYWAPISYRETIERITIFLKRLPACIPVRRAEFISPFRVYLLGEVDSYNTAVSYIRWEMSEALAGRNRSVLDEIGRSRVPLAWHEILKYSGTRDPTKFSNMLKAKRELFVVWIEKGVPPQPIDVGLIRNLRGLFESYLNEMAFQRQGTVDLLTYGFIIGERNPEGSGFSLSGFKLVAGNWGHADQCLVQPNQKTVSISQFPECFCSPLKTTAKSSHVFMCPVFRSLPGDPFMLQSDRDLIDGEVDNLQWHIPLKTEIIDPQLIATGVCIVCHLPDNF